MLVSATEPSEKTPDHYYMINDDERPHAHKKRHLLCYHSNILEVSVEMWVTTMVAFLSLYHFRLGICLNNTFKLITA